MSKINAKCSNFLKIVFLIIFFHSCTSAPINVTENEYIQFLEELNRNKCSVPSQVQLPFDTAEVNNFEYLSSYSKICQKTELTKRNKEAVVLCKEIFDNIRNISCSTKTALPDINVKLSKNVCKDINALKDSVPEDDKTLLKKLTDSFLCDIMCDSEFEKACQVLLWSFEVQKLIASVANAQEPDPNVPEDGGDINDNFKQDNAVDEDSPLQTSIDSKNEKKNVGEDVIEPNGTNDVSEPQNLEDNLKQKQDAKTIPGKNVKQEKIVSNNKEAILRNQTLPKAEIPNVIDTSKSATNLKSATALSQQMSVVQTSDSVTEGKLMSEKTKDESDIQNISKQVKSNVANVPVPQLEDNPGDRLSDGSDANAATGEQTQDIKANTFSDRVQDKKGSSILPNGHLQDNPNIPANDNVPLNDENIPNNEMLNETPQEDQNSIPKHNVLPNESEGEKTQNDAVADMHNNREIPSKPVDTLAQNKIQTISSNDGKLAKKTEAPSTGNQTTKGIIQQQTSQEKTSIAGDEIKTDKFETVSGLRKEDHTKTDAVARGLITDDGTMNVLKDQKEIKVAQQNREFENTIPNPTGTSVAAVEKQPEKSQKSKATVINSDGKSVIPSSLTETSTKTTVALEKMESVNDLHQPADEEADHFEDLEKTEDEEYSRSEYDGGLYEVSKNKDSNPNVPSPITVAKEIFSSQNERPIEFPSRNSFGQDTNDIQMIAAFPEQEDSHFFFYFLSIVLILMAGYLIFHNKQKIIALIVEGRHERNRRSHRIGYKKLETK